MQEPEEAHATANGMTLLVPSSHLPSNSPPATPGMRSVFPAAPPAARRRRWRLTSARRHWALTRVGMGDAGQIALVTRGTC